RRLCPRAGNRGGVDATGSPCEPGRRWHRGEPDDPPSQVALACPIGVGAAKAELFPIARPLSRFDIVLDSCPYNTAEVNLQTPSELFKGGLLVRRPGRRRLLDERFGFIAQELYHAPANPLILGGLPWGIARLRGGNRALLIVSATQPTGQESHR